MWFGDYFPSNIYRAHSNESNDKKRSHNQKKTKQIRDNRKRWGIIVSNKIIFEATDNDIV